MMACVLCNGCPSWRWYRNHWGCGRTLHHFRDACEYSPHIHASPCPCVSTNLIIRTGRSGTLDPAGISKAVGMDVGCNGDVGAICSSSFAVSGAGSFCPAEARFTSAAAVSRWAGGPAPARAHSGREPLVSSSADGQAAQPQPGHTAGARTASLVLGGRLVLGGHLVLAGHLVLGGRLPVPVGVVRLNCRHLPTVFTLASSYKRIFRNPTAIYPTSLEASDPHTTRGVQGPGTAEGALN